MSGARVSYPLTSHGIVLQRWLRLVFRVVSLLHQALVEQFAALVSFVAPA